MNGIHVHKGDVAAEETLFAHVLHHASPERVFPLTVKEGRVAQMFLHLHAMLTGQIEGGAEKSLRVRAFAIEADK
ncbi:hypothetical protein EN812_34970, partial [Mesorhizobium sp. M4B.F.Ca.ET.169.01.1.1]|uniref:hypothetical protein n=1 Tax=Mesorhizobium sp. M4B.F.Ca.ET.169.01.1.1 TaxID=2563949 RepID=UPI00109399BC